MKVLMVCLGNICRSPLAHGILKNRIDKLNLDWEVDSAGTSAFHAGEQPDERSIEVAEKNNINISNQRSRQFVSADLQQFDLIIAMDNSNFKDIKSLASTNEESKIKMLLNYSYPNENRAVPDPYYHGGFESVFEMISMAIDQLVEQEKE